MFPQVSSAFFNWTEAVQMKVVQKEAVDFELTEDVLAVPEFEMVLQAMSPQKVERKPENQRAWKFWEGWTTVLVVKDTVIQDPDGKQYRVQAVSDWSQGGFYHVEMSEQPADL